MYDIPENAVFYSKNGNCDFFVNFLYIVWTRRIRALGQAGGGAVGDGFSQTVCL